jgi:SEC-C motif
MGAIAEGMVAFAQPLLDLTDGSEKELSKAFAIGTVCFNLALLPEASRQAAISDMRRKIEMDDEEFDDFRRSILDPMIRRHQEMFPRMHSRTSTDPSQGGPSLWEQPRIAAPAETPPVTDRYAPCPCNSGRKFKFCCGKKGR